MGNYPPTQLTMTKIPFLPLVFCSIASAQISFDGPHLLTDGMQPIRNVITWDLDQDGDLDIVASGDFELRFLIWLNNGEGNFQSAGEWTREDTGFAQVLPPQDFNRDGNLDLLMAIYDCPTEDRICLEVAEGNSDCSFGQPSPLAIVESPIIALRDLDGDEIPEIVTRTKIYQGKNSWSAEEFIELP